MVSDKGTISIASSLDFEIKESYSLVLEARDGGNKFTRVQVNIAITNVNENTPKFDSLKTTFDFTINELTGSGTVLGQITVSCCMVFLSVLVLIIELIFYNCSSCSCPYFKRTLLTNFQQT